MNCRQWDWSIPVKPSGAESKSVVNATSQPTTAAIRRVGAALQRYPLVYGTALLGFKAAGLFAGTDSSTAIAMGFHRRNGASPSVPA